MVRQTVFLILIAYCFVNYFDVNAKTKRLLPKDVRARVRARIDFECATKAAFAKANLKQAVTHILRHSEKWGTVWGNIALPYDLNGDSIVEYFVPLQCSANGNCDWGVFAVRPKRYLGLIYGERVYPRDHVTEAWLAITTSGHISASESMLITFCFRKGKYHKCSHDYLVSAYKHNEPKWFGAFSPLCDLAKRPLPFEK